MKHILKFLFLLTLVFSSVVIIAQVNNVKSTRIENINGKSYYIHTVEKGQTLYGISKIYAVSVDEILEYNSEAASGLKKGMDLKILTKQNMGTPIVPEIKNPVVVAPKKSDSVKDSIIQHVVKQGETLYSISANYKVSVTDLKKWNANLTDQISVGDTILVRLLNKKDQVNNAHIVEIINKGVDVEPKAIPLDTVKKEITPTVVSKSFRGYYEVALMVPFMLSDIANSESIRSIKDLESEKSFEFIQFYESFLIAFKQFEKLGVKVTLRVYDITSDTNRLNKVLNSLDFQNVDMIIGPFFTSTYKVASNWAKKNQVYIVNPFSHRDDLFVDNPFTIKLVSSDKSQSLKIAQYCNSLSSDANVVVVHNGTADEKKFLSLLKQAFATVANKISVKDVLYSQKGIGGVSEKMVSGKMNIVISLLSKEAVVTNFVRRLYELKRENLILLAPDSWEKFDNIETDYFESLHLHLFDGYFVDYSNENSIKFVEEFRAQYNTEPDINKYAFQGYDICTYFVGALIKDGYSWTEKLNDYHPELISTKIKLHRIDENSGWENTELQIFKIENYKFVSAQ